jgi:SAM-dependent methyltransferase
VRIAARRLLSPEQRRRLRELESDLRAPRPSDLDALARYYGTDKGPPGSGGFLEGFGPLGHGYTPLYRRHFGPRRTAVRSVLEIGVGGTSSVEGYESPAGGQSLRMWRRYFPNAQVVGIDLFEKAVAASRIHFERGDATNAHFIRRVIDSHGPFDIVIDDGSHIGRHIIASFRLLWNAVRPGGFYVIEDLSLGYHADWEGGPPGTPGTAAELLKGLVDDTLLRAGDPFQPSVAAIHLYSEIVFLERSARGSA